MEIEIERRLGHGQKQRKREAMKQRKDEIWDREKEIEKEAKR